MDINACTAMLANVAFQPREDKITHRSPNVGRRVKKCIASVMKEWKTRWDAELSRCKIVGIMRALGDECNVRGMKTISQEEMNPRGKRCDWEAPQGKGDNKALWDHMGGTTFLVTGATECEGNPGLKGEPPMRVPVNDRSDAETSKESESPT